MRQHGAGSAVSLVVTWGGVWGVLLFAAYGAVFGAVLGLAGGLVASSYGLVPWGLGPTAQTGGVLAGALAGLAQGVAYFLGLTAITGPVSFLAKLFPGLLVAILLLVLAVVFERELLGLRGARRMSRREADRIAPLVDEICDGWRTGGRPGVLVNDRPGFGASAHTTHLVLDRGLLEQLNDDELAGVLAHELHHWRKGDAVGLAAVWACGWPVILVFNAIEWVMRTVGAALPLLTLILWILFWPFALALRLLIAPVVGLFSRRHEYGADAAAVAAGHGEGLYRALEQLRDVEPGRSGWERTVAATHPPTELRLEAIEDRMNEPAAFGVERCPSCSTPAGDGRRFCTECGEVLVPQAAG